MPRRLTAVLAAVLAAAVLTTSLLIAVLATSPLVAVPAAAAAQPDAGAAGSQEADPSDDTADETTTETGVPAPDIIPRPNSGRPPSEAGDRGGALQIALFVLLVAAVGGGVAKVVRDSRRARRDLTGDR